MWLHCSVYGFSRDNNGSFGLDNLIFLFRVTSQKFLYIMVYLISILMVSRSWFGLFWLSLEYWSFLGICGCNSGRTELDNDPYITFFTVFDGLKVLIWTFLGLPGVLLRFSRLWHSEKYLLIVIFYTIICFKNILTG